MNDLIPGESITMVTVEERGWLNRATGERSKRHKETRIPGVFVKYTGGKSAVIRVQGKFGIVTKTVLLRKLVRGNT